MQTLARQHPSAHVWLLHGGRSHLPSLHIVPELQAVHAAPLSPHCSCDWKFTFTQPLPEQQPSGQVAALHMPPLHAPFMHVEPTAQAAHALALVPHWAAVSRPLGMQRLPWQQPSAQFVVLHRPKPPPPPPIPPAPPPM